MRDAEQQPEQIPQAGAVPFGLDEHGVGRVLLITTRSGAWSIPKGMIDPGRTAQQTAEIECLEEAGIIGRIAGPPMGEFRYRKWGGECAVEVYPLHVDRVLDNWDEDGFREREWMPVADAAEAVHRPGLPELILAVRPYMDELIRSPDA